MFNLHPSFGFCVNNSYATTIYKDEIHIKRKDLPPEAIQNLDYIKTVVSKFMCYTDLGRVSKMINNKNI